MGITAQISLHCSKRLYQVLSNQLVSYVFTYIMRYSQVRTAIARLRKQIDLPWSLGQTENETETDVIQHMHYANV